MSSKNVLVLGIDGMLGSQCFEMLSQKSDFLVTGTSRRSKSNQLLFDASKDSIDKLQIERYDYVVNCIGLIKQKFYGNEPVAETEIWKINSEFPSRLALTCELSSTRMIQIATDCVFSGSRGSYIESDIHDATDLYGLSKSKGEIQSSAVLNIRTSIIGRETTFAYSLMDWFLSQPHKSSVFGYMNHYWNGVTTTHFSKVIQGVISVGDFQPGTFHLVPFDTISKNDLLRLFGKKFSREDIHIIGVEDKRYTNRTLKTTHIGMNNQFWKNAGYPTAPTIEEMIEEIASI
jgi:dTDP-4-dehydrorhamnose reductase